MQSNPHFNVPKPLRRVEAIATANSQLIQTFKHIESVPWTQITSELRLNDNIKDRFSLGLS